jgi:hypothetical protein
MTVEKKLYIHGVKGKMSETMLKDGSIFQQWNAQRIVKDGSKRFKAKISLTLDKKVFKIFTLLFVYKRSWNLINSGFACEEAMKFFPELIHLTKYNRTLLDTDPKMREDLESAGFLCDLPVTNN